MEQGPFTLRVIPQNFTSVLFADDDGPSSRAVLWDLSFPSRAPHPCDFTPQRDVSPQTAFLTRRWTPSRQTAFSGRSARESHPRTLTVNPRETVVSHSADRLAKTIVLATRSPSDPRTLTAWGEQVGVSRGALRVWCKAAGVSARSCLDFLRVLRAVVLSGSQTWDLYSILDVVDQRSLLTLLDRGGVRELCRENPPTVHEFVVLQKFLKNQQVLHAVSRRLHADRS